MATLRMMATSAGMFLVAGGLPGTWIALTRADALVGAGVLVVTLAVSAVIVGLLVVVRGHLLPRWAFQVLVAGATVTISVVVAVSPWPDFALLVTSLYAFIAIDAFFYFAVPLAVAQLVFMLAAAVMALSWRGETDRSSYITVVVVPVAIAWVTLRLVRRASSAGLDSLTGLVNRRGFDEALDAALAGAREDEPVCVVLLDADGFKAVNDSGGHQAGDDLLQQLAAQLTAALPEGAVLGRRGGDEFAVLLRGLSGREALDAAEELRRAASAIGLSVGVAQHHPAGRSAELLRRADVALYEAKAAGRGRCVLADEGADLVADLAEALAGGGVRVVLQPIVDVATGCVVGAEALARWDHPTRGPVSPAEFIPVAEASGLITDLGAHVLAEACRAASRIARQVHTPLLLTVNASGRQLSDPDFVDTVTAVLAATGWPARQLVLEVTESLVAASSEAALAVLAELRAGGVRIAIDDFGTGFSSLSRLDTLPADFLKLDNAFTATITTSPRRAGVLRAFLALAADLGMQVIAEGVEDAEQAALLRAVGCPLAQGWHFGRPQPPQQFEELVRTQDTDSARVVVGTS